MTKRRRSPPVILDHSDEEEARIQQAIADDPDTWEFTGNIVDRPTPPVRLARKHGLPDDAFLTDEGYFRIPPHLRPLIEGDGVAVTLHLDRKVVNELKKSDPEGWEDRACELLKKAVGL